MFQIKYLKYKSKYLDLKNKIPQKGGSKKNISTWGGPSPSDDSNKKSANSNKQVNKWD